MERLRAHRPAHHRHEAGSLLVELMVVAFILLLIIPMVLRWAGDVNGQATAMAARSRTLGELEDTLDRITQDLSRARACRPTRLDPVVRRITNTSLELTTDIDGDGDGDYVKYSIDPDTNYLTRTVARQGDSDNPCEFTENLEAPEPLGELADTEGPLFQANRPNGEAISDIECVGLQIGEFDNCDFTSLTVTLTYRNPAPNTPDIAITRQIRIHPAWEKTHTGATPEEVAGEEAG